jgi:uncharacterized protein YbjT (DUF2867 family)
MRIAVTGAFGYSGRYITARLLKAGHEVITLTSRSVRESPFGAAVKPFSFDFGQEEKLRRSLEGVDVLINTYWVRFDHRLFTHTEAVDNTLSMFRAALAAGVRRVVHVSITNPDVGSKLPYFRGKGLLEESLQKSGLSYCILRPTVLFGNEDVLINNIAWGLRRLPLFAVFGKGRYRLQPIYVDDFAALAAQKATERTNELINATGPETFTYYELVCAIRDALRLTRPILRLPPWTGYWGCRALGWMLKDVVITREEIQGLMEERLWVDTPPAGSTRLSVWLREHRETIGRKYAHELSRRRKHCC